ncbi:MAG: glyoxalase family protein [Solirubrobacteraceae bacterium]|jgi:glyoxalase family protein|nr:glyoxalase family protein [Solirubrobacteraceae bacterium]
MPALEGLHHITAITADAPRNLDFYARLLGLRFVKKTVNFDSPDVYHLYYADEHGTPGSVLTFFEFPGAAPGQHGDGMPYSIAWRVGSGDALDFWAKRLRGEGVEVTRGDDGSVGFADPEGLEHVLLVDDVPDAPLVSYAPDIPAEHALQGFAGVRAYGTRPGASTPLLEALGFTATGDGAWELAGDQRRGSWCYDTPAGRGRQGAGSIHHVAWSAADDAELERFSAIAAEAGARPTPIIDRQYFHSVYFREPSGVLFELASRDVGFTVDEPLESLGEDLKLPPQYEGHREEIEQRLTPLANPRTASAA